MVKFQTNLNTVKRWPTGTGWQAWGDIAQDYNYRASILFAEESCLLCNNWTKFNPTELVQGALRSVYMHVHQTKHVWGGKRECVNVFYFVPPFFHVICLTKCLLDHNMAIKLSTYEIPILTSKDSINLNK